MEQKCRYWRRDRFRGNGPWASCCNRSGKSLTDMYKMAYCYISCMHVHESLGDERKLSKRTRSIQSLPRFSQIPKKERGTFQTSVPSLAEVLTFPNPAKSLESQTCTSALLLENNAGYYSVKLLCPFSYVSVILRSVEIQVQERWLAGDRGLIAFRSTTH